jgi:UDP-2,4-diacetamido-2,4,6-trideoxy-beta-L-altropyranose hydrolase
MKIFIVTEGGKGIGFGHITRCTSIYQAFEQKGLIPEFVINGDNSVKDLLPDKKKPCF